MILTKISTMFWLSFNDLMINKAFVTDISVLHATQAPTRHLDKEVFIELEKTTDKQTLQSHKLKYIEYIEYI